MMHIAQTKVENFKCLRDAAVPLSHFSVIIGENNSGKSSILQALILLIKGTRLSSADYYDPRKDIVIDATLTKIEEADLMLLAEEHRERIRQLIINGDLRLVRRYRPDGTSNLRCIQRLPKDERFKPEKVSELLKGLSGQNLRERVEAVFPELKDRLTTTTQTFAKTQIEQLANSLPPHELEDQESDLPTGIENSIKALLPEPVYIPAVKDLADEVKTREQASFGRLLSILLNVIEPQLSDAKQVFATLNEKLNRVRTDQGVADNRLKEVKDIESLVQTYVQENFPSVSVEMEIPPPEIKAVLSNARILVNDGVLGLVDSKGDGLKRAITFAILRAYVTLSTSPEWQKDSTKRGHPKEHYLFLYEEPELYLHPTSQLVLFSALQQIAQDHQVVITTHSPMFLTPEVEGTFVKMVRKKALPVPAAPYGEPYAVDLTNVTARDQYQLICFDNNNAAFFSDTVVLVEGDSDYICLSHIAKVLNDEWDFGRSKVALVRVNGKGSIARYREFFLHFRVRTCVVADLDVLVREFDKLGLPADLGQKRMQLLARVDQIIEQEAPSTSGFDGEEVKKTVRLMSWRDQWEQFKQVAKRVEQGQTVTPADLALLDALLEPERAEPRLAVLKNHAAVRDAKLEVLATAREHDVFIFERGSIEDYYPAGTEGPDKPSKAQNYCKHIVDPGAIRASCCAIQLGDGGEPVPEFELICKAIFSRASA